MSFREKSAWIMAVTILLGALGYFWIVVQMSDALGAVAPPSIGVCIVYVAVLTAIPIFGHGVVAGLAPKEAMAPVDERDRAIHDRAGRAAGIVSTCCIVMALGVFLAGHGGNLLFHGVLASLMLAQFAEYAWQIVLYRRGV